MFLLEYFGVSETFLFHFHFCGQHKILISYVWAFALFRKTMHAWGK